MKRMLCLITAGSLLLPVLAGAEIRWSGGARIVGGVTIPVTASGAWLANKPASYTSVISDYAFDYPIPTAANDQAMGDGSGWFVYYPVPASKTTTRISDTTGTVSPTYSMQTYYEASWAGGVGRVKLYRNVSSSVTEFYIAMRVKWSLNYDWNPTSNKLFYIEPGNIILQSKHNETRPGDPGPTQWWNSIYIGGTTHFPFNNVTITDDTWHTIEMIVKRGTGTGELHVWLDGTKTLEETGIDVPTTGSTQELNLNDTWGGGGTHTVESWRWVDHLYIASP